MPNTQIQETVVQRLKYYTCRIAGSPPSSPTSNGSPEKGHDIRCSMGMPYCLKGLRPHFTVLLAHTTLNGSNTKCATPVAVFAARRLLIDTGLDRLSVREPFLPPGEVVTGPLRFFLQVTTRSWRIHSHELALYPEG